MGYRQPRGNGRRRILVAVMTLLLVMGGMVAAFRYTGYWLELQDEMHPARAIVVLGGGAPFRAIQAAKIYRTGVASEVWFTQGAPDYGDELLAKMRLMPEAPVSHEHERSEAIVEAMGVPHSAIRVIPELSANTVADLRAVDRFAGAGSGPVIVVTSRYHVRRVRVLWKIITGGSGSGRAPLTVRFAEDDPYDTGHWWRSSTDAISTFREVFGIVNAWVGFPVNPRDH